MIDPILGGVLLYAREMGKLLLIYTAFLAVERRWPAERKQPMRDWWFNFRYQALSYYLFLLFVYPAIAALTVGALKSAQPGWLGLIPFADHLDAVGKLLLFFLAYDLLYYGIHRLQHRVPWLWQQHKLHHSELSLNASTAMRHHWLEDLLRIFFIAIPLGIAFDITPVATGLLSAALAYWPYFIHANVRLQLGLLTPVIVGPQTHRLHHSIEPAHADCNFAAVTPLWDLLFGTYRAPGRDEFPRTGLQSGERVTSFWQANLLPFHAWLRDWRARGGPRADGARES